MYVAGLFVGRGILGVILFDAHEYWPEMNTEASDRDQRRQFQIRLLRYVDHAQLLAGHSQTDAADTGIQPPAQRYSTGGS